MRLRWDRSRFAAWFGAMVIGSLPLAPACANAAPAKAADGDTPAHREQNQGAGLSFGIGPQQSTGELARRWVPVLDYIQRRSGIALHFATGKDIPTYQREVGAGKYDFVYINPYHYTLSHASAGYEAFAQEKDAELVGVLVVARDSPVRSLAELHGKELAFPAPAAITATVLPLREFARQKIAVTPRYVTSHDSVYRAVAHGHYIAGGGEARTFANAKPEVRARLRVLWRTQALPSFVFAAHPRVPLAVRKRVEAAMFAMHTQPEGLRLLQAINFKGIAPAKDADYDRVRRLDINLPR